MEQLQKVMNDPESMKQISELAKSMGLNSQEPKQEQKQEQPPSPDFSELFSKLQNQPQPQAQPQQSPPPQQGSADLMKLMEIGKIMEKAGQSDKNIDLILALRPHLKAQTQAKADRLVKIFKLMSLYPILKESGILGGDLSGFL